MLGVIHIKYAVCMLAHQKPELIKRIVEKVKSQQVQVYIHLDARKEMGDFTHIEGVKFIENRVKVFWGGRSMVVAMYNLIEQVLRDQECDYILFISGEDYPIVPADRYHEYIDPEKNYITYEQFPKSDWDYGGIDRINRYYFFRNDRVFLSRALIKLQKILHYQKPYWRKDFQVYGGSQWININRKAAQYILENWKKYYRFFKYCRIPDEMIFQTILMNSPMKDTVINNNLRFLRFEKNQDHPLYLDERFLNDIHASKSVFCRKIRDTHTFDAFEAFFTKVD